MEDGLGRHAGNGPEGQIHTDPDGLGTLYPICGLPVRRLHLRTIRQAVKGLNQPDIPARRRFPVHMGTGNTLFFQLVPEQRRADV